MRILLIAILMWTVIDCNSHERKESVLSNDLERITQCGIEFYIPSNLKEEKIQPIDSCAKEYRSENIRLLIDVLEGTIISDTSFTRSTEYSGEKDFKVERIKIDGKQAEIITFLGTGRKGLDYGAVLDIPQMNLTIWTYSKSQEDREIAIKVFKSIRKSVS
jgi:hypothetical protein